MKEPNFRRAIAAILSRATRGQPGPITMFHYNGVTSHFANAAYPTTNSWPRPITGFGGESRQRPDGAL